MSKLKNIQKKYGMLNESFAWERQEGKPLPTLEDVQAAYNARSINEQEDTPVVDSKVISHREFRKNGGSDLVRTLNMYKNKFRKLQRDTRKSDNAVFTIKELADFHRHMAEFLKIANNSLEQQMEPVEEDPDPTGLGI